MDIDADDHGSSMPATRCPGDPPHHAQPTIISQEQVTGTPARCNRAHRPDTGIHHAGDAGILITHEVGQILQTLGDALLQYDSRRSRMTLNFNAVVEAVYRDLPPKSPSFIAQVIFRLTNGQENARVLRITPAAGEIPSSITVIFCPNAIGPCQDTEWSLYQYLDQVAWQMSKGSSTTWPYIHPCSMSDWWTRNGQSFRLFDLPLEIRDRVYLASVGYVVQPFTRQGERRFHSTLNTSLFLLNRQVTHEALHAAYAWSTFYFEDYSKIEQFFTSPEIPINSIKRLELSLDHIDYKKFFGYKVKDDRDWFYHNHPGSVAGDYASFMDDFTSDWTPEHALRLREMPLLQSLVLWMPHPSRIVSESTGFRLNSDCHSSTVRSILGAAWPYVRGLPVTITGYIRDEDKKVFEDLVERAQQHRRRWEKLPAENRMGSHWDFPMRSALPPRLPTVDNSDGTYQADNLTNNNVVQNRTEMDEDGGLFIRAGGFALRMRPEPRPELLMASLRRPHRFRQPCRCGKACGTIESWHIIDSPNATGVLPTALDPGAPRVNPQVAGFMPPVARAPAAGPPAAPPAAPPTRVRGQPPTAPAVPPVAPASASRPLPAFPPFPSIPPPRSNASNGVFQHHPLRHGFFRFIPRPFHSATPVPAPAPRPSGPTRGFNVQPQERQETRARGAGSGRSAHGQQSDAAPPPSRRSGATQ
ncbi:hypothetical protein KVT40_006687 [Elsinoe batatas]|uniref:Uncharacterized protein n=1 Tax=Elsinoe batatas TaxID=2601811 RepID=A0A8K0KZM7_9PEZI|nr:hypothetical protein KVT40_006687 [Elsinoe batatas]